MTLVLYVPLIGEDPGEGSAILESGCAWKTRLGSGFLAKSNP